MKIIISSVVACTLALSVSGLARDYRPADEHQRPASSAVTILPEKFLRGFDPVTVYFRQDRAKGPAHGPADNGRRLLAITPAWPGAWYWLDRRTLQFRPAESWPALARYQVKAAGASRILTTMMSAPLSMSPAAGSDNLRPFRTFSLTFSQALKIESLRKMISIQIRDLPGLESASRRLVEDFNIAVLPRRTQRDPVVYALTLAERVPEGKQLVVVLSLALGDEGKVLWKGRLSTRPAFQVESIACGDAALTIGGSLSLPAESALACGHYGQTPQIVFSAQPKNLTLSALKKLVRLDPAVEGLGFQLSGRRVLLSGKFVPEILYRLSLHQAPLKDLDDRSLEGPGRTEAFFYLGHRQPFVRWRQARGILEAHGPRMLPLVGYGDRRADVRIYRIDPLHAGLWPFPGSPVVVDENSAPPFPGEEPERGQDALDYVSPGELTNHLRLLGSPLISEVIDLPLSGKGATTRFGLDIGRLLDKRLGRNRPGHYLVGLRRLSGPAQRSYVRVQVTNLSLTSIEERQRVVFYVRAIDTAKPVSGAQVVVEAIDRPPRPKPGKKRRSPRRVSVTLTTDADGRAVLERQPDWKRLYRISVRRGEDVLVLDPNEPPPRFANNHWSPWGQWLHWIGEPNVPEAVNDRLLGFVFTERPIYRPGEKVFIKGYLRQRKGGRLLSPGGPGDFALKVQGPGGKEWPLRATFSKLMGFSAEFSQKDAPTGNFSITLYRKKPYQVVTTRGFKIEAYRIPTFEVRIAAPDKVRNDGPFRAKALARYYAGGSVASRPIEWSVTRRPYHYMPRGRKGYMFASSTQFSRGGRARPPETLHEQGTLTVSGAHEITVNPALDMDGSARIYRIEASVTGVDNQVVGAMEEVKALPPFVLGMQLKRYYQKATRISPRIIAVGIDDKPSPGQKVKVRLYRRTWHSHLRETDFSTGKASYVTEQEDKKVFEKEIVSGKKPVTAELPIAKAGVYLVELTARDKLGRVQTLSADLYVGGKEALAWKKSRQGVFELSCDKKSYAPGDTARLIIKSPFQRARALIVLQDPGGNSYFWKNVEGGKAGFSIPIRASHAPNLPVNVVLMRGRLGRGNGSDERYRPRTLAASLDIKVRPTSNEIKLAIKHPKTVRPGSIARLELKLSDDNGRPLAGEVTLWLADEAVLALANEGPLDPLSAFILQNSRSMSIRDTRNELIGRLQEEDEPAGDGSEEDGKGRLSGRRRVRKNFKSVPYYAATLEVGPSGKLVVPIKMSDDLTNFKIRAVAASGMSRFGYKSSLIHVRLPLLVQPQLPRFIRQGDEFWAGGVGRLLEGAEGAGAVAVKIDGLGAEKNFGKKIELKRNQAVSHLFPVSAHSADPTRPGEVTVKMEVERKKDGVGDAFEVKLPILPDRTVEHFAYFDTLASGKTRLKPFPEKPRAGTAVQEIEISNVPGALELLAALDYLESYPHGCLEQKMSRLMPQMAIGKLLRKLGLNEHYALQVGAHVKRLLGEMDLYQTDEGFFSFWPGGAGSVSLTAQAARFMNLARGIGIDVPPDIFGRTVSALKTSLRSDFRALRAGYRYNQQTSAIRALVAVGELDESYLTDLYHHRGDMDVTSLADLAMAMNHRPVLFKTNLGALRGDLWDHVVFKLYKGKPVCKGIRWYRRGWYTDYLGSHTSTLAAVIESLVSLDPENPRLSLLRDALLAQASAERGFGSTYSSRRAAEALLAYLDLARPANIDARAKLSGGGSLSLDQVHKVARARLLLDKPQTIEVSSKTGLGLLVRYDYLPDVTGDRAAAAHAGFVVSRSNTIIHKDGSPNTHFDDQPGKEVRLKLGDIVEIQARLLSDKQRFHVALVVPFAAGLEPLNPELKTSGPEARPSAPDSLRADYVQRMDDEVRYYFIRLPKGSHSVNFRLRATNEGSFVHPPPWAEQMYHQEVRGRGDGMRVEVKGEHQK